MLPNADGAPPKPTTLYLEEGISNSFRNASTPDDTRVSDDYFRFGQTNVQSASPRAIPPNHVDISSVPVPLELALIALQYLPTPVLVLSDRKKVLLANDAFGLLLGLNKFEAGEDDSDTDERDIAIADLLEGQSLSQIGIDMIQDGQPIWVNWEVSRSIVLVIALADILLEILGQSYPGGRTSNL